MPWTKGHAPYKQHWSAEMKKYFSERLKGHRVSERTRELFIAMAKKPRSEEYRRHSSFAFRGNKKTTETIFIDEDGTESIVYNQRVQEMM